LWNPYNADEHAAGQENDTPMPRQLPISQSEMLQRQDAQLAKEGGQAFGRLLAIRQRCWVNVRRAKEVVDDEQALDGQRHLEGTADAECLADVAAD
jgi:hypothetical protein